MALASFPPAPDSAVRLGRQVAFWAPKGGVGATTLAVNVAAAACEFDLRVAYADLDHRGGDGALFFGTDTCDLESPGGTWRHGCGLRGHVAAGAVEAEALASGLRAGHDLVVLDLPSGVGRSGVEADLLVVVVGCSLAALVRARRGLSGGEAAAPPACVVVAAAPGAGVRPGEVDAVLGFPNRAVLPHDGGLARRGDRGVFSYGLHRNAWARVVRELAEDLCAGLAPVPTSADVPAGSHP
ncbi:MAG: hypothetical protein U0U69_16400 [Acidimicrobiia bacterium]